MMAVTSSMLVLISTNVLKELMVVTREQNAPILMALIDATAKKVTFIVIITF